MNIKRFNQINENIDNQRVYMVIMNPPIKDNSFTTSYALFTNEIDAKNYILNSINDNIDEITDLEDLEDFEDYVYEKDGRYFFIDCDEAVEFINEKYEDFWSYDIEIETLQGEVKLSEDVIILRDVNKYNM